MVIQKLDSNWTMQKTDGGPSYAASVPNTVYSVLMSHHVIEDPYWKDNEVRIPEEADGDYLWTVQFDCNDQLLSSDEVILHFDGLDTDAEITLNGTVLGSACNMHRTWEYQVKSILKPLANQLTVLLRSPFALADAAFAAVPAQGSEDAWRGFSQVRKAHYMYGWDWGAHLPDAGIFRHVSLLGVQEGRIDSVYVTQHHDNNRVTLNLDPSFLMTANRTSTGTETAADGDSLPEQYTYDAVLTDPDGNRKLFSGKPDEIVIEQPKLWWPNGLGDQPLYELEVILYKQNSTSAYGTDKGKADEISESSADKSRVELDRWKKRIGLRTLSMVQEKDEWGISFAPSVNGIQYFAMGADYIPEEHILGKLSYEKRQQLLEDAAKANFNSIRVWGGGYYPDDSFFDLCDELGLVVWEDFMFACSAYRLTPEFEENIRQELIDNVKRIRHHASLGLWCGNNEMESFVNDRVWITDPSEVRDYLFLFERVIPEVLREYDPQTFYWPSSPSSGGAFDKPQDPTRGDVHFWDVWHGNKPFTDYRQYGFRYLSEFGFQSFPAVSTIREGISDDPDDHNIFSYVMEKHQRNASANGKIMNYMQQTFRYPYDFDSLVYASQLLQADGIRYGVEHFRRHRGRCMGAVYWQLNDCWPVASWSSIDYYGRWKALQYTAKRFFAPLMISCEEKGWMSSAADMNRQDFSFEKSISLNAANETRQEKALRICWQVRSADARVLREETCEMTVPALSAVFMPRVDLPDIDIWSEYVSYQMYDMDASENEPVSEGTVIFSYPKYFHYQDPRLSCRVEGDEIVITADAYAKYVEIRNDAEDLLLSDNYFDMNAGEKRVKILRGNTENLRLRSVYNIGR